MQLGEYVLTGSAGGIVSQFNPYHDAKGRFSAKINVSSTSAYHLFRRAFAAYDAAKRYGSDKVLKDAEKKLDDATKTMTESRRREKKAEGVLP